MLRVSQKSKTVFWLSVRRGGFTVAFYFAERLRAALLDGALSDGLKARIRSDKPIGKMLGVRVEFGARRGVRDVLALIQLKNALR